MSTSDLASTPVPALGSAHHWPGQRLASSEASGWSGLLLQTFQLPATLDEVYIPAASDYSLALLMAGACRSERRLNQAPWNRATLYCGDLSFTPQHHAQRWRWQPVQKTGASVQVLHLHIAPHLLARAALECFDAITPQQILLRDHLKLVDPFIQQIALTLYNEVVSTGPGGRLLADTLIQALAVHLIRTHCQLDNPVPPYSGGLPRYLLRRVNDYMHTHLARDIRLTDLAELSGYSPYHFARLFRRSTGQTPHHYLLQLRIERAQQLLREKNCSIAEIACAVGFSSQSHLTSVFRQRLGVTPKRFRERL